MEPVKEKQNNNNPKVRILSVKWKDNLVGYLMKDYGVGYLFKYDKTSVKEAMEKGFVLLPGFPSVKKTYTSDELFQIFKSRIPTKQRRDLPEILNKLGVKATGSDNRIFDDFDYLSKSHGTSFTDFLSVDENFELFKKQNRANIKKDILRIQNYERDLM